MKARARKARASRRGTCELADDVENGDGASLVFSHPRTVEHPTTSIEAKQRKRSKRIPHNGAAELNAATKSHQQHSNSIVRSDGTLPNQQAKLVDTPGRESPPAFTFKQIKTHFRERKILQQAQRLRRRKADDKRIRELIDYFAKLDKQKIEVLQ